MVLRRHFNILTYMFLFFLLLGGITVNLFPGFGFSFAIADITPNTPSATDQRISLPITAGIADMDGFTSGGSLNTNHNPNRNSVLMAERLEVDEDLQCISKYDNTIITWKNLVDRQKNIQKNFGDAVTNTTTITTQFVEICGNHEDDDKDGMVDENCPVVTPTDNTPTDNTPTDNTDTTRTETGIDIKLRSLDINRNINIDKRDHTTIVGTEEKDYIVGSPDDDLICSEGGPDVIFSNSGIDAVFGSEGQDTIQSGSDNNQIFGEDEGDSLVGGPEDDLIVGGEGDDRLFGDFGNDVLEGGEGSDYFDCGEGIDIVLDFEPEHGDIIKDDCETS